MNIENYLEAKGSGFVTLQKFGNSYQILKRRFNPDTGAETPPEGVIITREEVVRQRDVTAKTLATLDALLADIDGMK